MFKALYNWWTKVLTCATVLKSSIGGLATKESKRIKLMKISEMYSPKQSNTIGRSLESPLSVLFAWFR